MGQGASFVLGQQDPLGCSSEGVSSRSTTLPGQGCFDRSNNLYLADTGANRVLIFTTGIPPTMNAENAETVLGQIDFVSFAPNFGNDGFDQPSGIAYDPSNNAIWVIDTGTSRIQRFANQVLPIVSMITDNLNLQLLFQGSAPNVHMLPLGESFYRPLPIHGAKQLPSQTRCNRTSESRHHRAVC